VKEPDAPSHNRFCVSDTRENRIAERAEAAWGRKGDGGIHQSTSSRSPSRLLAGASARGPRPVLPGSGPPAWRALWIGCLLIPPSALFGYYGYLIAQAIHWSQTALLRGPIFVLCLVLLANALFQRVARRLGLLPGELTLIYAMLIVATAVGGIGFAQFHVTGLPAPFYYATSENRWDRFHPLLPSILSVRDPRAVTEFFKGSATLYAPHVLRAWIVPVMAWTTVLGTIAWVMLCVNVVLRRPWVEGERLTFPLVVLPLRMVEVGGAGPGERQTPFWRSRLMWLGFALAGAAESLNSLNWIYPAVPSLPIKPTRLEALFVDPPWNGMGMFAVAFYPFMIGVAFLLTLDVSFSCLFFYLLVKAELVLATALGLQEPGAGAGLARAPYIGQQAAGAFLGLAAFILWTIRRHLLGVGRAAVRGRRQAGEESEILSYRTAVIGIVAGLTALTLFFAWLGLPAWLGAAFFVLYFLFQLIITRIVAEAGAGWTFAPAFNPHAIFFAAAGTSAFSHRELVMLTYVQWIDMDYRDSPMSQQLQSLKMGQAVGLYTRTLRWGLLLAILLGLIAAFWAQLHLYYVYGAASAKTRPWITSVGQQPFHALRSWIEDPLLPDPTALTAAGAGAAVVSLLALARQRILWWPFHPIGYAVGNTASMDYMWMPFFVAWVLKSVILRYGGMPLYRAAIPFFLGLILGDYVVPTLWAIWGLIIDAQMYMSFPH
jgi:hypothetical protein